MGRGPGAPHGPEGHHRRRIVDQSPSRADGLDTRKKYLPSADLRLQGHRSIVRVAFQATRCQIEVVDQAVAVRIFGLPRDHDLVGGGPRQGLGGGS